MLKYTQLGGYTSVYHNMTDLHFYESFLVFFDFSYYL